MPSPAPHSTSPCFTPEMPRNNLSLSSLWNWRKHITILNSYVKYKRELLLPYVDEQSIWRKIAKEVEEECLLNCEAALCRNKVDELRSTYDKLRNENVSEIRELIFLNVARKAFKSVENSVASNPQVKRQRANKRGESMTLSRTRGEAITIRVANLSEKIEHRNLRKLFMQFGAIARIYITKNKSTGVPKGVAFIEYKRPEDASRAIAVDGFEYDNQILSVQLANQSYSARRSYSPQYSPRHSYDDKYYKYGGKERYSRYNRSPMSSHRRHRHVGSRDNPEPSRCLFVCGLSRRTQEIKLREVFEKYGPLEDVQVVYDAQSGRARGFAFVYFEDSDDAKAAKDRSNGQEIDGRKICIDFSIPKRFHTPTRGIYMGKPT